MTILDGLGFFDSLSTAAFGGRRAQRPQKFENTRQFLCMGKPTDANVGYSTLRNSPYEASHTPITIYLKK
jgi:hypothetical protein